MQRKIIGRVFHSYWACNISYFPPINHQLNFTLFLLFSMRSIYAIEVPFFSHDFLCNFFIIEFKAFSNLEELYLSENKINDFVTTRGTIVCTNICSWIKFKNYFFCMVCQMKLSCRCFWDILFCPIDSNILTKLQLLELRLNDFSARVLESLIAFPSLKTLDLSDNNLEGSFTAKGKLYHWHRGGIVLRFSFHNWHNSRKAL